ncbi:hypothetical protein VTO42DRAFT_7627 [Malbranchea cinnamomea]
MSGNIQPGLEPPPGHESNFENPDRTVQTWNTITQALCIGLTTISFLLRMYCRIFLQKTVGIEDWVCVFAWIGGIGYSVTALMMGHYGGGLHQWDVPIENVVHFKQTVYGTMVLYGPVAFATKATILLLVVRVFAPFKRLVMFTYVFFGILTVFYLPVFIAKICICIPVSRYWKGDDVSGKCLNERALILADAFMSVISDFIILILPVIASWSLNMSTKKKLRVIGLLGAGGLACGSSLVRLVFIMTQGLSSDSTHTFMRINLWGNAEVSIGIICACLPFCASLIKKVTGELSSKKTSNLDYHHMSSLNHSSRQKNWRHAKSQSQTSLTEAASDQAILISHPHTDGKVETNIEAHHLPDGNQSQNQSSTTNYIGQGIMRTVDVSHTVTTR